MASIESADLVLDDYRWGRGRRAGSDSYREHSSDGDGEEAPAMVLVFLSQELQVSR
jgi:hypothetical protein